MSAYTTMQAVQTVIPATVLTDALDDDGDGKADPGVFDGLNAICSAEIDGYLGGLYNVPFVTPPAKVQRAAFVFVCEAIFQRRNVPAEKNPYTDQGKWWREHLQKVGNREIPFDAHLDKAFQPGAMISEPVKFNAQTT